MVYGSKAGLDLSVNAIGMWPWKNNNGNPTTLNFPETSENGMDAANPPEFNANLPQLLVKKPCAFLGWEFRENFPRVSA